MPNLTDIVKDIDQTRVKHVASIADLQGLTGVAGQQVSVASYHGLDDLGGGGTFVWGTGRHNGGTFIDPNRAFPTDWNDQAQLTAWFVNSGVDVVGLNRVFDGTANVKMFGAVDSIADSTSAIQKAIDVEKRVFIPEGTFLVSRAIRLNQLGSGRILSGAGKEQTTILRTDTTVETIDGVLVQCILFVSNGDHHITDLALRGYDGALVGSPIFQLDGIHSNDPYRGKVGNVKVQQVKRGIYAKQPWAMVYENILVRDASQTAFDFSSSSGKTSLSFTACVCENVGNAFLLTNAYYSTMTSCAADYVNYTDVSNPYGRGYGSRASDKGIYHIDGGNVTLNGCGSENSYGNGVVCLGTDNSSDVTINNLTSFLIESTYVPATAGWAVGPIQCGNGPKSVVINGGRFAYSNSAVGASNPIADIVAFNYNEGAYGARDVTMVMVNSLISPYSAYPFAGRGNHTRYCRYGDNTPTTFTRSLVGSGTVLTIPIIGNDANWYRHLIRLLAINNQSGSTAVVGTEVTIQLSSGSSINAPSVAFWNDKNIASISSTGLNLEITLTSSLTNPTVVIEPLYAGRFGTAPGSGNYQPFINFENMSIV